jgi:lipopolysaccharide/colanic/teichoic acid biosynthesis glycosyltransferase
MLVIIGDKYYFDRYDRSILNSKFNRVIFLPYYENDAQEAVYILDRLKENNKLDLVVLNIEQEINRYLKNYLDSNSSIKYMKIDEFLERYLFKYYVSLNSKGLKELKTFSKWQYFQKRVIDIIGVIILSIVTAPIMLYSIYRIKKESPGSIIFKQTRVGLNNKKFTCYKFRTMHENSYHNPYTKEDDDRVFPWGKFMRKTRIDELPQMWNILKGDMHLIGPRPEWDILVEKYKDKIPYYSKRHLVKTGITGWAQVNYPYGSNEYDAYVKLMYDLYYEKNWSIWLELKTIFRTINIVLSRKGL